MYYKWHKCCWQISKLPTDSLNIITLEYPPRTGPLDPWTRGSARRIGVCFPYPNKHADGWINNETKTNVINYYWYALVWNANAAWRRVTAGWVLGSIRHDLRSCPLRFHLEANKYVVRVLHLLGVLHFSPFRCHFFRFFHLLHPLRLVPCSERIYLFTPILICHHYLSTLEKDELHLMRMGNYSYLNVIVIM